MKMRLSATTFILLIVLGACKASNLRLSSPKEYYISTENQVTWERDLQLNSPAPVPSAPVSSAPVVIDLAPVPPVGDSSPVSAPPAGILECNSLSVCLALDESGSLCSNGTQPEECTGPSANCNLPDCPKFNIETKNFAKDFIDKLLDEADSQLQIDNANV